MIPSDPNEAFTSSSWSFAPVFEEFYPSSAVPVRWLGSTLAGLAVNSEWNYEKGPVLSLEPSCCALAVRNPWIHLRRCNHCGALIPPAILLSSLTSEHHSFTEWLDPYYQPLEAEIVASEYLALVGMIWARDREAYRQDSARRNAIVQEMANFAHAADVVFEVKRDKNTKKR